MKKDEEFVKSCYPDVIVIKASHPKALCQYDNYCRTPRSEYVCVFSGNKLLGTFHKTDPKIWNKLKLKINDDLINLFEK